MKNPILRLSVGVCLLFSTAAFADKVSQAKVHFQSIANADIHKIMGQYQDNARLHWIGGPLDGSYSGDQQLRKVWSQFTKALGPMDVSISEITENANPKGSTVTANVLFKGKKTVPVRYVIMYRDNHIANEIWQISPALGKK